MSQKSSVVQILKSVPRVLTSDTADVFDQLVRCVFQCSGLLVHLDLLIDSMNQNSFVAQIL
ncbi:MAG: hypothetical protein VR71_12130 [Roseovarius sp. BRH_c41]|nr:MAG: hypothetical protein VR71_12130 [Roseovarius sp. BRH_c41]